MHYYAGIFDAEGFVTLIPSGHFIIGIDICHQATVLSFQKEFGGKIYEPKGKTNKKMYQWRIPSSNDEALNFINRIIYFSIVKKDRLYLLREYLDQTRDKRRATRSAFVNEIALLKKPRTYTKDQLIFEPWIKPDEDFFKWFAGFMDGDGTFSIYEYQDRKKRNFDSWISIFNTFAEPIIHVQQRIKGSISAYKGVNFPIWKWVCNQKDSEFLCDSLYPHLILKKEQCRLTSEYLLIHKAKIRGVDRSLETVSKIQDIIRQIKYHNSL